jgi:ABC-2 type transport system ATP-binding protein
MAGRIPNPCAAVGDAMADAPVSIRADALGRTFGPVQALGDVDLAVDSPRILGLVGPNGSGKTTLIKCLLGLLDPTSGTAAVNGTDARTLTADDRARIGYMPQHDAVYGDLTVRENVAFFARLYDVPDRDTAVDRTLSFVDLEERATARIGELSGGMVRRTSLACALVHDPDVLVLDEPTVGLDPELRATMWDGFRDRRDAGDLVLVSTHYLGEATRCDDVCILRDGDVLAIDTPDALLDRTGTADLEAAFLELLADRSPADVEAADGSSTTGDDGGER